VFFTSLPFNIPHHALKDSFSNVVHAFISGVSTFMLWVNLTKKLLLYLSYLQHLAKMITKSASDHNFIRIVCYGCGHVIDVPLYCGNRFCEICGVSRRSRVRRRMQFLIDNAKLEPHDRIRFLTLTIRNQLSLPEMINFLMLSFRKLRNRSYWKSRVRGGCYVIEITGLPGNWHAHLHCLIAGDFIEWDRLLFHWRRITGSRGVWITNIDRRHAIKYLCKYLVKPDVPDQLVDDISSGLRSLRLFQPFGDWHKLNSEYKRAPIICPSCGRENSFDAIDRICASRGVVWSRYAFDDSIPAGP